MFKKGSTYKQIASSCVFAIIITSGSRGGWVIFGIQAVLLITAFVCTYLETRRAFAMQEIGHGERNARNIGFPLAFALMAILIYWSHSTS